LTSITIPAGVTAIDDLAFSDCKKLTRVHIVGNAPSLGYDSFESTPATIYYLPGTTGWGTTYADRPTAVWTDEPPGPARPHAAAPPAAP
jgi:hypothetical protein